MPRSNSSAVPANANEPIAGRNLPHISSTRLATDIGAVTREVMREGAAVITRHDAPMMVLVSMDRYAELERASTPDLDELSGRFDTLFAQMQVPGVADRTIGALDLDVRAQPRSVRLERTAKTRQRT